MFSLGTFEYFVFFLIPKHDMAVKMFELVWDLENNHYVFSWYF